MGSTMSFYGRIKCYNQVLKVCTDGENKEKSQIIKFFFSKKIHSILQNYETCNIVLVDIERHSQLERH